MYEICFAARLPREAPDAEMANSSFDSLMLTLPLELMTRPAAWTLRASSIMVLAATDLLALAFFTDFFLPNSPRFGNPTGIL
jgi:hypothetical protein